MSWVEDVKAILDDLANSTDGLGALKTLIDAIPTVAQIQTEMEEDGASLLDTIRDELANGSDGLTALKSAIDAIPTTMVGTDNAALATVLEDAMQKATGPAYNQDTDSQEALRELLDTMVTSIAAIPTTMVGTDSAATVADGWDSALATILDNFSATRIGYLDQLDFALQEAIAAITASGPTKAEMDTGHGLLATEAKQDIINALVDSAEAVGPMSYLDAGGEQTVKEDTATNRRRIWLEFSNRNMTQSGKFILYRKVDGSTYDIYVTELVTVAADDDRAFDVEFTTNQAWKLTYTEDVNEGAARAIPYNVITQVIE